MEINSNWFSRYVLSKLAFLDFHLGKKPGFSYDGVLDIGKFKYTNGPYLTAIPKGQSDPPDSLYHYRSKSLQMSKQVTGVCSALGRISEEF